MLTSSLISPVMGIQHILSSAGIPQLINWFCFFPSLLKISPEWWSTKRLHTPSVSTPSPGLSVPLLALLQKWLAVTAFPAGLQAQSRFAHSPEVRGWHFRNLSFLRISITPSPARASHLSRFALILEQNELQWGDTVCSITQYFTIHFSVEKDFFNLKTTYMQGWGRQ